MVEFDYRVNGRGRLSGSAYPFDHADVAELVDATGLGPVGRKPLEVRVLSSACPWPSLVWGAKFFEGRGKYEAFPTCPRRGAGRSRPGGGERGGEDVQVDVRRVQRGGVRLGE